MIRLYGDKASQVQDGQVFKAVVRSVEGRKVVELVEVE